MDKENVTRPSAGPDQDKRWVLLDEKYFRRLDKFSGDASAYRGWIFDLVMVLNQIDPDLAKEVNKVIGECGNEGKNGTTKGG